MAFSPVVDLASLDGTDGFRLEGACVGDRSGSSVSDAGDVNGDGIGDLIVGAYAADPDGRSSAGESYVVFGRTDSFPAALALSTLDGSNGFRLEGSHTGSLSGASVSNAGDVDGDGIGDLIVGAPLATLYGRYAAGESYVVLGRAGAFPAVLDLGALDGSNGFRLQGDDATELSGTSVSGAGDINGDGLDDLIVGAPFADPGRRDIAGLSYVVFGRADGFPAVLGLGALDGSDGFRLEGIDASDYSGGSVSAAGDVNGDGFDDLIVGARLGDPNGVYDAGESYVVFGRDGPFRPAMSLAAIDGTNGFRLDGLDEGDRSGGAVAAAGDINGDGLDDLIVGAYGAGPGGRADAGSSYVVFGRTDGFGASLALDELDGSDGFRLDGIARLDGSGMSVSAVGDANGDGIGDLIIGAQDADPGGRRGAGETYVVFGHEGGFAASLDLASLDGANGFRITGVQARDLSGHAVSGAGDVNDDGIDDLLVGAPGGGRADSGESYVVFGRAAGEGTAADDAVSTRQARPVTVDVLGNDLDTAMLVGITEQPAHGVVTLLADSRLAYLPDPGFVGSDRVFYRAANEAGLDDIGRLSITVRQGFRPIRGGDDDERLGSGDRGQLVDGGGGGDELRGRAGDDTLSGAAGDDILIGGSRNDVLIGGPGADLLNGGTGADRFVLTEVDPFAWDTIGRLDPIEGDRLLIAIAELLLPDGSLDGARVRIEDAGGQKRIMADLDGDGPLGFTKLAQINGGAGLDPDDFLANAISIA